MLRTTMEIISPGGGCVLKRVEIASVTGGAISDYRVREFDNSGSVIREVLLTRYPQWSEEPGALVARALDALWPDVADVEDALGVADIRSETFLVPDTAGEPRLLYRWALAVEGSSGRLEAWDVFSGLSLVESVILQPRRSTYALIVRAQCLAVWRQAYLKSWPDDIPIPVHTHGDIPYVRDSDIPGPVRDGFERFMRHSTRPLVPGEGSCAYSWDFVDFLGGER